jgi:hypothetical protein
VPGVSGASVEDDFHLCIAAEGDAQVLEQRGLVLGHQD